MPWEAVPALVVGGLVIGSFLNVVIYRVPLGMSVNAPRSACPGCHQVIRWYDNIPVLSWLLLQGRCRDCGTEIGIRYPLVEAGTAVLWLCLGWRFGWTALLPALLFLGTAGIALALIDLDHKRLPFAITVPALPVTAGLLAIDGFANSWDPAGDALISMAVWGAFFYAIWFLTAGRGMGFGDVVLAPTLGLVLGWIGWGASVIGLFAGFAFGAVVGVTLMALGVAGRRSAIPFGPFMIAGAIFGAFVGQHLWSEYLDLTS